MNKKLYEDSIILIGPSGAGKSTVADDMEKRLKMPRFCLDRVASEARRNGHRAKFRTADEFNYDMIHTLITTAEKYEDAYGVVDFGAGHSIYKDKKIFNKVKKDLKPFKNVVLLLPCRDEKRALEIMASRSTGDISDNEEFLKSSCNKELATMVVYADGRTPQEISDEIISRIEQRKKRELNDGEIV